MSHFCWQFSVPHFPLQVYKQGWESRIGGSVLGLKLGASKYRQLSTVTTCDKQVDVPINHDSQLYPTSWITHSFISRHFCFDFDSVHRNNVGTLRHFNTPNLLHLLIHIDSLS